MYLSELYGQLWDVCYLHRNLQLDVRIIYNTTAAAAPPNPAAATTATPRGKSKGGMAGFLTPKGKKKAKSGSDAPTPESVGSSGSGGGGGPTTREEALLKPELEAVFSARRDPATEAVNALRAEQVCSCGVLL